MLFKFLRSPSSTTDRSKNSRFRFNVFYFAIGDTQKDSGLEIEFMLDTGASCSIINYRTFWEICQTQHPIAVNRSTKQTKTYSSQVVLMIGSAKIKFSYHTDGHFSLPLALWMTDFKTHNFLGIDFCREQLSGIYFDFPEIELKEPPLCVMEAFIRTNLTFSFLKS